MPVASLVRSRSRRTLKAGCRADMVGIAGRGPTDIGRLSLNTSAHQTHADNPFSETSGYLRLFRSRGQEGSHEHDKAGCQPEKIGGNDGDHGVTHGSVRRDRSTCYVASCQTARWFLRRLVWDCGELAKRGRGLPIRRARRARQLWKRSCSEPIYRALGGVRLASATSPSSASRAAATWWRHPARRSRSMTRLAVS